MPISPSRPLPPTLIVSIHDVSPLTFGAVQAMERELRDLGVTRLSHLVIPDHHRTGAVSTDPELVNWLRVRREQFGDEIILHGYHHLRERCAGERESPWTRVVTRSYTAGEGEFYDLGEAEASELLAQGRAQLEQAGLGGAEVVRGFIAPAWLLGPAAERAVRNAGFRYTTRLGYVRDFATTQDYTAQSLCWSVRSAWRRQASLRWNDYLLHREQRAPLIRIGLHPVDYAHPQVWAQIRRLIRHAREAREPRTYLGLCETVAG